MVKRNYNIYAHYLEVIDLLEKGTYFACDSNLDTNNPVRRFEDLHTSRVVEVTDSKEHRWIGVTQVVIPRAGRLDKTNDRRTARRTLKGLRAILGVLIT